MAVVPLGGGRFSLVHLLKVEDRSLGLGGDKAVRSRLGGRREVCHPELVNGAWRR